jgi:hypothetical protein
MLSQRKPMTGLNACEVGGGEDTHSYELETFEISVNEVVNTDAAQLLAIAAQLVTTTANA